MTGWYAQRTPDRSAKVVIADVDILAEAPSSLPTGLLRLYVSTMCQRICP
jgi:hypothetical protein